MDNIIRYVASMTLANEMLDDSIITRREFLAFEKRMCEKYELPECSLYRTVIWRCNRKYEKGKRCTTPTSRREPSRRASSR